MLQVQTMSGQLAAMNTYKELNSADFMFAVVGFEFNGAQMLYFGSMMLMLGIVTVLYWHRGVFVILRIVAYLVSLSTITLTIKNLIQNYDYPYPKLVTCFHFLASGGAAFMILAHRKIHENKPIMAMTVKQQLCILWPIAAAFAINIGANNLSLVYLSAGFVEMINSACPLGVIAITLAMGRHFNFDLTWPVVVVCLGIAMCTTGELRFSFIGFWLAVFATFLRALKNQLQGMLMDGEDPNVPCLDPIELLAWMSIPSLLIMLVWSIATEGIDAWTPLVAANAFGLNVAILVSSLNALVLNVFNLYVIKDVGALGITIVGQLKGILIILGGVAMLGESVQFMQLAGFGIVVGGVYWYNNVEKAAKQKQLDAERLPLNKEVA